MLARRLVALMAVLAAAEGAASCGGDGGAGGHGQGGGGSGGGCGTAALVGADGACHPIGVQGCADVFIDADGLCRPSLDKCKKGEIPKFDEGCVAVGIPTCAAEFVGDDGICHVKATACAANEMAVPEKGCVPLDGPDGCGTGTWGDIPDQLNTMYVDPAFPGATSYGTKVAPYISLADALKHVEVGGHVALAAGTYHEHADLMASVDIRGRCPSLVILDGVTSAVDTPSTIHAAAGSAPVTVEGVTLAGPGIGFYADADSTLDGVVIDGALHHGVVVHGATTTLKNSLVRGVRSVAGIDGDGVFVFGGGHLIVSDGAIVQSHNIGVFAKEPGSLAEVTDVAILDTDGAQPTGVNGEGVFVESGGQVHLTSSAVVGSHLDAIEATDDGTEIIATHTVLEGTLPQQSDGYLGVGVQLYGGAMITVNGSVIADNRMLGILASDSNSTLNLDTTLVTNTLADPTTGTFGRGLEAQGGVHAILKDSAFVANREIAIVAFDTGTKVDATRLLVDDTQPAGDGQAGVGIFVNSSSWLVMKDSVVSRGHVAGVAVAGAKADVTTSLFTNILAGTIILQNPAQTISDAGDGLLAMLGGEGPTVTGVRAEGCARAGLLFDGGQGSVVASSSTNNRYGIVLEGGTAATHDAASEFADNQKQDELDEGMLPVPNAPLQMPQ